MSTRCWIAAALLAVICAHAPGQVPPEYTVPPGDDARFSKPVSYPEMPNTQPSVKPRLEMRVYQVADLIVPLEKNPAPLSLPQSAPASPVMQTAAAVPACPPAWSAGTTPSTAFPVPCPSAAATPAVSSAETVPQRTLEKQLIGLLTNRIAPGSWNDKGGPGSVDYYPLGMALIVNQTPAVHKQVRHLLESLRKLQDVEVALEVRFVSVSEPVFERLGTDFNNKPDAKPATLPPGPTFLDDKQLRNFLEAVQGDQRSNVMQAPKLTVANGQSATLDISDVRYYVTGVDTVRKNGQTMLVPKNEPKKTGLQMSVRPAVSADRRYVQLNLKVARTEQASPVVPLFPVVVPVVPHKEDGSKEQPVSFTQFIQQPAFNTVTLEKTAVIPDSQTVMLGGWKSVRETRNEYCEPVLSKIPYVNRLFTNVGYGRETETVVLLVTPRIIVNEREESRAAKGEKTKEKKLAKVREKYEQACKDGKLEEAKKLARKALELDPACFAHGDHQAGAPNRRMQELLNQSEDLKSIEYEWKRFWSNDQPSHLTPERVHGKVGQ
jgi:hypothetical protein